MDENSVDIGFADAQRQAREAGLPVSVAEAHPEDVQRINALNALDFDAAPAPKAPDLTELPTVTGQQARAGAWAAMPTNPTMYADAQRQAREAGLPVSVAEAHPEDVQRINALNAVDFDTLATKNPVTASFLAQPDKAKLLHDDIPVTTGLEDALSYLGASGKAGWHDMLGAGAKILDAIQFFTTSDQDLATLYKDDPVKLQEARDTWLATGLSRFARSQSAQADQAMGEVSPGARARYSGLEYATLDGDKTAFSSPARVFGDLIRSLPTMMAMAVTTYVTKNAAATTEQEALAAGLTAEAAQAAGLQAAMRVGAKSGAATEGTVGYAQQANSTQLDADKLPQGAFDTNPEFQALTAQGYDPIAARVYLSAKGAEQSGVNAGLWDAVTGAAQGLIIGKAVTGKDSLLKRVGEAAVQEGATEAVQSAGEQVGQNIAERDTFKPGTGIFDNVGESGVQGLVLGTLSGGLFSSIGGRASRMAQTDQDTADIARFTDLAANTQLATRDPEAFKQFIETAAPTQQLYMDADALYQSGLAERLAAISPSAAEQLPDAIATGGQIAIPAAEYAANIAPDPLAGELLAHLKTDPHGYSQTERDEAQQQAADDVKREVDQALRQATGDAAFKQSIDSVKTRIADQLNAAGRNTAKVNDSVATMVAARYGTMAARLGVTPEALWDQRPVTVVGENILSGDAYSQQGDKRPLGAFSSNGPQWTIGLFKGSNLSTPLHEFGHFFLDMQMEMAQPLMNTPVEQLTPGQKEIVDDTRQLLDWFGHGTIEDWYLQGTEAKRPHHEKFAESFEAYLFEGKAPSIELQNIFQEFRAWLLAVYRRLLAAYNNDLSAAFGLDKPGEIRQVMDRMFATTEQIKLAEQANAMMPLFHTQEESRMTPEAFEAYQKTDVQATQDAIKGLEARGLRDMLWARNLHARVLKGLQREAKRVRAEVRRSVRPEIMSQPVYQAWQFLTGKPLPGAENEGPHGLTYGKIDPDMLADYTHLPEGTADKMKAHRMLAKGGMSPEVVAELNGFQSGDEMLKAIGNAEPPKEVIEAVTDQRMLEQYSDLATEDGMQRAADSAIHNSVRARMIAAEANALSEATGGRKVLIEAAKSHAQQMVNKTKIRNLNPRMFTASEAKAARAADKAFRKGDTEMAAAQKRNQLYLTLASRAALDAKESVSKGLRYLAKFRGEIKTLDIDYADQIAALLDRFDLRKITKKELERRESLARWIDRLEEEGIKPDIPPELENEARHESYLNLSIEEFQGLIDTVKQIEHLGRLKNRLLTAAKKRDFEAVKAELLESITANANGRQADTQTAANALDRIKQNLRKGFTSMIKAPAIARVLDGGANGPVWQYLIRNANAAGDMETTMRAEAMEQLSKILDPVTRTGKLEGKAVDFPTIGASLNRGQRLAMALNVGNAGNLQRLLDGKGWKLDQIQPVLQSLTDTEWNAVQQIWDFMESYKPHIAAKERRVYGREPAWVEPTPVTIVREDGSTVKLRGGYFPVRYDPMASVQAEQHDAAEQAKAQLSSAYTAATTRRSFTKARAEEVKGRPLLLQLSTVYDGVNEVIHDLSWNEYLIDANRITRAIAPTVLQHYGVEYNRLLKHWLSDIGGGDKRAVNSGDIWAAYARKHVSAAGLAFNLVSAAQQPLGLTNSMQRIGVKWVGQGVMQYTSDMKGTAALVNEKSEFMRGRARTAFRELAEFRNRVQDQNKFDETLGKYSFVLMLRMQQVADYPTWIGGYNKALANGSDESEAVALGDQAVIDAQGSGMTKDLSGVERGTALQKLFTVFYSFMNTTLNLGYVTHMTERQKGKYTASMLMLYVAPAMLTMALKNAIIPGDAYDYDDDEWLSKMAKDAIANEVDWLMGQFAFIREASETVKSMVRIFTGDEIADYQGPAGLRIIQDSLHLAKQAQQGDYDAAFRKSLVNFTADLTGLPGAQLNRTWTGLEALSDGETSNPLAIAFGYQKPRP
jgi:hypothetical protein